MRLPLLIILITINTLGYSQEKIEKETRIETREVPEKAIKFIEPHNDIANFKWYKEVSERGISYEAKGKINGQWYSVEFDKEGVLEDVEVQIKFKVINEKSKSAINTYLRSTYQKHKIVKVQIQFSDGLSSLQPVIDFKTANLTIRYEIVLYGTKDQGSRQYEITFSHTGEHIKTVRIAPKNLDNLEY